MTLLRDMKVLEVSHKYGLSTGSIKAQAFTLFEQGYSPRDVSYLLRRLRRKNTSFSSTIRRYYGLWKARQ